MWLFGPPNVDKLKSKRNVKGLIKALRYKTDKPHAFPEGIRKHAAEALGQIGEPRAVEPLIAALRDELFVREAIPKALGQIGDKRAVEALIGALREPHNEMREAAAAALGQIGDKRAVEPLVAALRDKDRKAREAAAKALEAIGWEPGIDEDGAAYWFARREWDRCVASGAPAVDLLIAAMRDDDEWVRLGAAEALGQIGDAHAVEPLIAALTDEDLDVRKAAAKALAKMAPQATGPLIAALRARDLRVSKAAPRALALIGDTRAVEALIAALQDGDVWVRPGAAQALGQIGDKRAVEPLIEALQQSAAARRTSWSLSSSEEVCMAAGQALGQIGDGRAVAPLIATLQEHHHARVMMAVAQALIDMYRRGDLDYPAKQQILAAREQINQPHTDYYWGDLPSDCSSASHEDIAAVVFEA